MIIGAHSIIYSKDPDADRAFLRDALRLPNVDVGEGWLIFGLPPAELAVHPSGENDVHEFYLMCADVEAFIAEMKKRGIECAPAQDQGWGVLTQLQLPGGGKLGVYQPRHARPEPIGAAAAAAASRSAPRKSAARAAKRSASKKSAGRPRNQKTASRANGAPTKGRKRSKR